MRPDKVDQKKLAQAVVALAYRDEFKLLMQALDERFERVRQNLETAGSEQIMYKEQGRVIELRYLLSLVEKSEALLKTR